jgi:hypothetical protein
MFEFSDLGYNFFRLFILVVPGGMLFYNKFNYFMIGIKIVALQEFTTGKLYFETGLLLIEHQVDFILISVLWFISDAFSRYIEPIYNGKSRLIIAKFFR